jgi:hypothetical protein
MPGFHVFFFDFSQSDLTDRDNWREDARSLSSAALGADPLPLLPGRDGLCQSPESVGPSVAAC